MNSLIWVRIWFFTYYIKPIAIVELTDCNLLTLEGGWNPVPQHIWGIHPALLLWLQKLFFFTSPGGIWFFWSLSPSPLLWSLLEINRNLNQDFRGSHIVYSSGLTNKTNFCLFCISSIKEWKARFLKKQRQLKNGSVLVG